MLIRKTAIQSEIIRHDVILKSQIPIKTRPNRKRVAENALGCQGFRLLDRVCCVIYKRENYSGVCDRSNNCERKKTEKQTRRNEEKLYKYTAMNVLVRRRGSWNG